MSLKNRKRKELDLEIGNEKKEKNGSTLGQEHKMDLAPVDPGLADLVAGYLGLAPVDLGLALAPVDLGLAPVDLAYFSYVS